MGKTYTQFKPKHIIPSMEDVKTDESLAFTFNPAIQEVSEWTDVYDFICNTIYEIKPEVAHVKFNFEISPLGRLHIHGYITVKNIPHFYIHIIPFLICRGTVAIVPVKYNEDGTTDWDTYISKQQNILKDYFEPYSRRISLSNYIELDMKWLKRGRDICPLSLLKTKQAFNHEVFDDLEDGI